MDDDTALRAALLSYVTTNEPPERPPGAAVAAAGRRSMRMRRAAWLAAGAAAVVALTVGALGLVRAMVVPAQLASGALAETICPPPPPGESDTQRRQVQISCYLAAVLPALMPNATYHRLYGPGGTAPFEVYPSGQIAGGFEASAVVVDARGAGSVSLVVSPLARPGDAPTADLCQGRHSCVPRTGPHGERIAVYSATGAAGAESGRLSVTVYVYSGRTMIVVGATNADERHLVDGVAVASRREPPLSTEQLINIATAPELVLFP